MKKTHLYLIFLLALSQPVSAEIQPAELLRQCLPTSTAANYQSKLRIEVNHKKAAPESHHYLRLETAERVFIRPDAEHGPGLLIDKTTRRAWIYEPEAKTLTPVSNSQAPLWLISETLLQPQALPGFQLQLTSHNNFGGQDYFNLTATKQGDTYPKRNLSFKQDAAGNCRLIRAAYFDQNQKLSKKLFFQWQTDADALLLKALHIEDVSSLEAVRYHIEEMEQVDQFAAGQLPQIPD